MNGILTFFANGGRSGPPRESRFKRIDKKTKREYGEGFAGGSGGGGGQNDDQNNDQNNDQNKPLASASGAQSGGIENNFIEDLKKLAGPQGSGTFLFTSNPNTKAFMNKYGLDTQDIINLRLGFTQRGFQGNITDAFKKAQSNLNFGMKTPNFFINRYKDLYDPDYAIGDRFSTATTGLGKFLEPLGGMGFFGGIRNLAGSDQAQRGMNFARNVLGLKGDDIQKFGATVANQPNLFNSMMMQPEMQRYEVQQLADRTFKGLPTRGGNKTPEPTPDPITAAYDPSMNPFLNSGIGNFRFFT
jgi:hypothetical protein